MKRILITLLWTCFFLEGIVSHTCRGETVFRRYQVESGIIEYSVRGAKNGKEVVYFDQWGMREAKYSTIIENGFQQNHLMNLQDKEWTYIIDFDKRIANKRQNENIKKFFEDVDREAVVDMTPLLMASQGAEKLYLDMFNGNECDVWVVEKTGTEIWLWKGIVVKKVDKKKGHITIYEAIKIEADVPVPEQKFLIPENIYFMTEDIRTIVLSMNF